jgi:multiple sugar transport system substrate-binding protein
MTMIRNLIAATMSAGLALAAGAAFADQTLRFATWDSNESLEIQKAIAAAFEAAHPGVKVQVEAYGDGYDTKIAAGFGAGDAPDVMYMWNFPAYEASLLPLDGYLSGPNSLDMTDFAAGLLPYARVTDADGTARTLGIPAGYTSFVAYYNKDMFDAAGIPYPTAGWTWDDLRAAAAKLAKPDEKVFGFGVDGNPDPYDFETYLWSNGSSWISPDGKTTVGYLNSPETAEVFQMFVDMVKNNEAVLFGVGDNGSYRELFNADKLGIVISGIWPMPDFEAAGKNFGVVELPSFGDKPVRSNVGISSLSIAKDSAEPDLAWEFVKFYASPEAVAMRTNDIPVLNSVAAARGMTENPKFAPFIAMLPPADGTNSPAFLRNPNWGRAQEVVNEAIQQIYVDMDGIQAILDDAAQRADKALSK